MDSGAGTSSCGRFTCPVEKLGQAMEMGQCRCEQECTSGSVSIRAQDRSGVGFVA